MTHSEQINEIATALAKAQGEMHNPGTHAINPFGKYTYAQANDFLDTIRAPLSKYGIAFIKDVERDNYGKTLYIMLLHSSGQWIKCFMPLENDVQPNKQQTQDQAWGSHLTYRKKSLISLVFGIHGDKDNDGEEEREDEERVQNKHDAPKLGNAPILRDNYERVSSDNIKNIMFEIGEHTDIAEKILKQFNIQKMSDIPKDQYLKTIDKIRTTVSQRKGS